MTKEKSVENFISLKRRDMIKNNYCNENNILLLRIPYWGQENIDTIVADFLSTHLLIK